MTGWGNYGWKPIRDLVGAWRITGDAAYRDGALEGVNALLGGNAQGQVYITGLGNGRASAILHLPSFVDGIDEPVPGLPLFGPQSYLPYQASTQVFGLYYDAREDFDFAGLAEELVPGRDAADADAIDAFLEETIPFWRRYFALEQQLPPYTEFAVHETVGPAVAVTGCLLGAGWTPGTDLPRDPLGAAELEPMRWVMP